MKVMTIEERDRDSNSEVEWLSETAVAINSIARMKEIAEKQASEQAAKLEVERRKAEFENSDEQKRHAKALTTAKIELEGLHSLVFENFKDGWARYSGPKTLDKQHQTQVELDANSKKVLIYQPWQWVRGGFNTVPPFLKKLTWLPKEFHFQIEEITLPVRLWFKLCHSWRIHGREFIEIAPAGFVKKNAWKKPRNRIWS